MRHRIFIPAATALLFALAACTQDELAGDNRLPEGEYPVIIRATGLSVETTPLAAPSTRSAVDGDWQGVTSVALKMGDAVKEYTVTASTDFKSATLSRENDPYYWTSRNPITVSAWWPFNNANITQMPAVKVAEDQSKLADFQNSDFISAENRKVEFNNPTLEFTHRTARVTIELKPGTGFTSVAGATVSLVSLSADNSNPTAIKTYTVYNADGLLAWNEASQKDESINCTLAADIDLTGKEWTRSGIFTFYSGVFNGQGHRITGFNSSAMNNTGFLGSLLSERGVIKNLQLIDVNLYGSSGNTAGIVGRNHGQIIACSVTGKISASYGGTCGIAESNYGDIIACWFDGTLKESNNGAIVRYNYADITSCYWGGNAGQGVFRIERGTVDATKVDGATVKWQTAVDGMNTALTAGDYQWILGTDGLPVLQKRQ